MIFMFLDRDIRPALVICDDCMNAVLGRQRRFNLVVRVCEGAAWRQNIVSAWLTVSQPLPSHVVITAQCLNILVVYSAEIVMVLTG